MAISKQWRCLAHGSFEGAQAVCTHGCTTVVREFLDAPALRSQKTKISDRALDRLAARYNLTDLSNRNGSVGNSRAHPKGMEAMWRPIPAGNVYEVGKGEVARDGAAGGATAALSAMGVTGGADKLITQSLGLPRPRPHARGHEPGSSADFDNALRSAT